MFCRSCSDWIRYCGVCVTIVLHAGLRVEPERRRGLPAAASVSSRLLGDVALGEPSCCGAAAVRGDAQLGLVEVLLDAQVDETGHAAQRRADRSATSRFSGLVPTIWTSIGAGRPKFRIWLTMSAGRNVEGRARELVRQPLAQSAHVVGGGPWSAVSVTRMSASPLPMTPDVCCRSG